MLTTPDGPRLNNAPEKLFSEIKSRMARVLEHPYLPPEVGQVLLPILRGATMLRDDKFAEAYRQMSVVDTEKYKKEIDELTHSINAVFIAGRGIVMRRRYFEQNLSAMFMGQDLLAEELGHAYRVKRDSLLLSEIPDMSLALIPFKTKKKLLNELRDQRIHYFEEARRLRVEDIVVEFDGFCARYVEPDTGIQYPVLATQNVFEEMRAACIQTVLEIFYLGNQYAAKEKLDARFAAGLKMIMDQIKTTGSLYAREHGALLFVSKVRNRFSSDKEYFHWLFPLLYIKTLDEFDAALTREESDVFLRGTLFVAGELSGRVEQSKNNDIQHFIFSRK